MKTTRLLLAVLIFILPTAAVAQSAIFDKYHEIPNVSSVFISKTMLDMRPDLYTKDVYIGKVAGQLDGVYMVSSMDKGIKSSMSKDINDLIKKGKYEMLMKQKGITSGSTFYIKRKGDNIKELIMITDGPAKLSFVHLVGDMTLKDIQQITNSNYRAMNTIIDTRKYNFGAIKMEMESINGLKELINLDVDKLKADIEKQVSKELKGIEDIIYIKI